MIETAVQRLEVSQKQGGEAYTLAEKYETNPRSVWVSPLVRHLPTDFAPGHQSVRV